MTDHIASIGLERVTQPADRQLLANLLHSLGLLRVTKIDCRQPIDAIVRKLEKVRPDVITGYAGAVTRAAQAVIENDIRSIRPRFVTTGAEVQTPAMRRQIAQAFACPVYNVYGSHEFNILAAECPKTGDLHTCDDLIIVEVLRGTTPVAVGERGEVVATNLHSWTMPFIRYRLDDLVTRGPAHCRCGAPFATIQAIQGRMLDYLPLSDGRLIHPYQIIDTLLHDRITWMRQYQIVQERADLIIVRAAAFQIPSPQRIQQIHQDARNLFGPAVEFHLDFVSEIPMEANGKYRLSRSNVQSNYEGFDWERVSDAR